MYNSIYDFSNFSEECKNGENKMCGPRSREGECKPSASNPYFQDMILNCPAACGLCSECRIKEIKFKRTAPEIISDTALQVTNCNSLPQDRRAFELTFRPGIQKEHHSV